MQAPGVAVGAPTVVGNEIVALVLQLSDTHLALREHALVELSKKREE
jgi:hypothetical protein